MVVLLDNRTRKHSRRAGDKQFLWRLGFTWLVILHNGTLAYAHDLGQPGMVMYGALYHFRSLVFLDYALAPVPAPSDQKLKPFEDTSGRLGSGSFHKRVGLNPVFLDGQMKSDIAERKQGAQSAPSKKRSWFEERLS